MTSLARDSALRHVEGRAEAAREGAVERALALLGRHALGRPSYDALLRYCRERARVTINFHPDRPTAGGLTVVEGLLADGFYQSQFLTQISNGSRTAFPGGDRDLWEKTLFGGAYHDTAAPPGARPKYGGLDVMRHADGACPRFGSCYLTLRPHVLSRCTFTWGDSHLGPEHVATINAFEPILAALLEGVEATGEALGVVTDVPSLVGRLAPDVPSPPRERAVGRALDAYIEAQVHGDIDLSHDVEALVIDPAFEDTPVGERLRALCARHAIALESHPGFVLAASAVPADFRGPRMVPLAARLGERFARVRGELDAVAVGRAAQSLHHAPQTWHDWGAADETLQHLKQMWHVLVRYGRAR